jgi:multifunctional methyltransferase subunit TRM112
MRGEFEQACCHKLIGGTSAGAETPQEGIGFRYLLSMENQDTTTTHNSITMKILTLNFLTCAVKTCKTQPAAFPLHVRDAELEQADLEFNPLFINNILPRIEWPALASICGELGLPAPIDPSTLNAAHQQQDTEQTQGQLESVQVPEVGEEDMKKLHTLLLETQIQSGKLVCGNCGHEYAVREGIANFLLPAHLV